EQRRWRNTPRLAAYVDALTGGRRPEREVEPLRQAIRDEGRVMLGLPLDEPLLRGALTGALDTAGRERRERLRLARGAPGGGGGACPDREGLPVLRGRASRAAGPAAGTVPARLLGAAARGRLGARGDDGDAVPGDAAARARLGAAARDIDRPSRGGSAVAAAD